jgi:hypothetical protein
MHRGKKQQYRVDQVNIIVGPGPEDVAGTNGSRQLAN